MTSVTKQKLTATPEMIAERMGALEEVRKLNPYRALADPVAWQREIREDVVQPVRPTGIAKSLNIGNSSIQIETGNFLRNSWTLDQWCGGFRRETR